METKSLGDACLLWSVRRVEGCSVYPRGVGWPLSKNRTGYEGTSGNYLQDLVTALAVVASAPNVEVKRFSLNPTDPYLSDVV